MGGAAFIMPAAFFEAEGESAKALCCKVRKWYTNEDTQGAPASREQETQTRQLL